MSKDAFEILTKELWALDEIEYDEVLVYMQESYNSGRASMLAELRAKWPSKTEVDSIAEKCWRFFQFDHHVLVDLIKKRIFGGVDE